MFPSEVSRWILSRFRRSQNAVEDALVERLAGMLDAPRVCGKVQVAGRRHRGLPECCELAEGREGDLEPSSAS